jgi:uncharacterized protein (TIGR02246 family)
MKRLAAVLLLLVLLLVVIPVNAQVQDQAVHDALRRLKTTMEKALNARDLDSIVANVSPDVVFTTMNGDVCHGPQQIRAYFDRMLTAPDHIVKDVKVAFDVDALTTLYGGDTGVAIGSSRDHYELTDGKTFDIQGRWTCTMVKSGDRWVIAAFHYSANIFRNPILDRYRAAVWQAGIAAALAGVILGFLLARLLRRRRA